MSKQSILLAPFTGNGLQLKNRMVMAPLTRSRATPDHIPTELQATYYRQRAGAGLIITEGTAPSPNGVGYPRIPGIYNQEQTEAWKMITNAVHGEGGKIFIQLMHTGRVSHPDNMPAIAEVLAPSVVALTSTQMYTDQHGNQPIPAPKAMTREDINHTIKEFVTASKNAIAAGFDGVELHAANGYLLDQFLNANTNQRSDDYGGSTQGRSRIVLEIAERVIAAIGKEKVGIRLSPNGALNEMGSFAGQAAAYTYLIQELNKLGLVYIHLVNHASMGAPALPEPIREAIRSKFDGLLILSGGYDKTRAEQDLEADLGDLVAFGRPFLANPDLPERFAENAALNEPDYDTFYTPGAKGYVDYPELVA